MNVQAGSTYLTASGIQLEAYEWGAPKLKADAAVWDAAGNEPNAYAGDRHDDCSFTLTCICMASTASATDAKIAALVAAVVPNASLTVTEGLSANTRYTYVRTVSEPKVERHFGTWARVTLTGTRCPYWHGDAVAVAEVAINNSRGTVDVADVPGDVCALTRYYLAGPAGTTGMVLGVKETDAGFTSEQDESGTVDGDCIGGEKKNTTLAATWATVSSVRTLTTASYQGRYLICARVSGTAADKLRAKVTTGSTIVYSEMSVLSGGGLETVITGPVTIPATAWTRDFPSTTVELEAKGTVATFSLDAWWLIGAPSPLTTDAAIVHLDSTLCLDGIPMLAPNCYAWVRASDDIAASTLDKATPWGWPMLRPGDDTLHVLFSAPAPGTGYLSASYVPRYLTSA